MNVEFLSLLLILKLIQQANLHFGEFHVAFTQNFENLILNNLKEKLHICCLVGFFFLKII